MAKITLAKLNTASTGFKLHKHYIYLESEVSTDY